jgi:hypothetical protein
MLCVSTGWAALAGALSFFAAGAEVVAVAGFVFGAEGAGLGVGAAADFSPRAMASISATLGRPPPAGFFATGAAGCGGALSAAGTTSAADLDAALSDDTSGGPLDFGAPALASACRAAAKISATVILLLSAITPPVC